MIDTNAFIRQAELELRNGESSARPPARRGKAFLATQTRRLLVRWRSWVANPMEQE